MKFIGISIIFIVLAIAGVQSQDYRLPKNIEPISYKVELTPYFKGEPGKQDFTFDGVAQIRLTPRVQNISEIILHILNLQFEDSEVNLEDDNSYFNRLIGTDYDNVTHKYTFKYQTPLLVGQNYTLSFVYTGLLNDDMNGFYRSSYVENNVEKWIATTQMQPIHARQVFPCFDEPEFKATFDITINRPATFTRSFSNTKIISTTPVVGTNKVKEVFATTPKMSTYLLAFIVSELRIRDITDGSFGVIARPDAYNQTEYALAVGQQTLAKMDEWTDYRYFSVDGIDKMDMAALPDFSAGAMENWGLLTYRETALLYDPNVSTFLAQQRVASVITHEQAHMWFGDLVTCEWWSYTWLNEGFARYFQYFGTALVEDTWDLGLQFVAEQLQAVLATDSTNTTRSMTFDVNSPSDISRAFDTISYNKGASVIRMTEHLMGSDRFKTAMQAYLKEHAFSTSTPDKLYAALQRQTDINIANYLSTWTSQVGYPVVTVERDNQTLRIFQQRFILKEKNHSIATKWQIPLNYATSLENNFESTSHRLLLNNNANVLTHELNGSPEWIVFNVQQTGYYRVNYDNATWRSIEKALKNEETKHSGIHLLNRAQIVDDALNLARGDHIDYNLAMSLVQYLEHEDHYIPWLSFFNNLPYIARRFDGENLDLFKKHILSLSENIYEKLANQTNDTRLDVYNRGNIFGYACKYGHEGCIKMAQDTFVAFQNSSISVPVNIRPVVYCTAVANGGEAEWQYLWNRFLTENVAAEQVLILSSLGCTKDPSLLRSYMDLILTNAVRLQDKASAFTSTYNEQLENTQVVLDYVISNHENIARAWNGIGNVQSILSNVAARFTSQAQIDQLQKFYDDNRALIGESQTLPNAIAEAKYNLEWAETHIPVIVNYIESSASFAAFSIFLIIAAVVLNLFV